MTQPLASNGMLMPSDFPSDAFERTYTRVRRKSHSTYIEHFTAAWNALSYRYLDLCFEGDEFTTAIGSPDGVSPHAQRYLQERHLFGFFGTGFSAFEAYFYGMFAIGGMLHPASFPMITSKDQQAISPPSTRRAYDRAFPGEPILGAFDALFTDPAYREWKDIRNILTHRTAPGRTIFASVGSDLVLPPRWKINNIVLDDSTAKNRRKEASRMLTSLLIATADFVDRHLV